MKSKHDSELPKPRAVAPGGSAEGVESEACEYCEGVGSISYNPNLNPNAFLATATARCKHCDGTGMKKAKPQPNGPTP